MSDTVEKLSQDNGGTGAQAPLPYESVWMAHWMRTNCPSSSSSSSLSSRAGKIFVADKVSKQNDKGKQPALVSVPNLEEDTFGNAEELKEIIESAKPVVLEDCLKRNSNKLSKGHVDSFPTFIVTHKRENFLSLQEHAMRTSLGEDFESGCNDFPFDRSASILTSNPAMIRAQTGTSSGENYFQPAGLSLHSDLSMKPHNFIDRSSLAPSTSNWNDGMKPILDLVPHGYNSIVNSMLHGNCGKNQNMSSLFSHPSCLAEGTETQKLWERSSAVPHLSSSLHDVETMRIYTTVDSVQESSRGHPRLSQTTHHLWITKKTNANFCETGQFAKESKISSKFMGSAFKNLFNLSPDTSLYGQQGQGVKLLSLGGLVDGDEGNVREVNNSTSLKNESSAETNIMDINLLQENHLPGIRSLPSNKPKEDQKSLTFQTAPTSSAKGIKGRLLTHVPDTNQPLPELPASLTDDRDSTSRTQTLDMEHVLANAKQIMDSKSISYPASSVGPEPSSRWIKRLKSAYNSAYGTKSLNLEDNSQALKVFKKIVSASDSISDPKFSRYCGEEQIVSDVPAMSFLNGGPSSSNSTRKSQDIKLSHPWIQRWTHVQSASSKKNIESVVACDPEKSNSALEEALQKQQLPSTAALALMGKALNGFRPCKFMKRGSIMLWNTNGD